MSSRDETTARAHARVSNQRHDEVAMAIIAIQGEIALILARVAALEAMMASLRCNPEE